MTRSPWRFLVVLSVTFVALLIAFGFALSRGNHQSRSELERTFSQRPTIAAALLSSTLESSISQSAAQAAATLDHRRIGAADIGKAGGSDQSPMIVADAGGRVIGSVPASLARVGSDARSWGSGVADVLAGKLGGVTANRAGTWSIVVGVNTRFGRRITIQAIPLTELPGFFESYLGQVRTGASDNALILDRFGHVIGVGPQSGQPALRHVAAGDFKLDEVASFAARAPIADTGWDVVMTTPQAKLYAPIRGTGAWIPWLLLAGFAALVLVVLVLVFRLVHNGRALESANRELAIRNAEVVAADRLKSDFLATMSHELRTPLNGIIGFAELMYDGRVGEVSDQHREFLGDILSSSTHLRRLIDDILDLSKIEAGRIDLHPEPIDCGAVVAQVRDAIRSLADRRHISLICAIDSEVGTVELDPGRLKQVLFNYLSNALKFTPLGGHVEVRVEREGDAHLRLTVKDDGPGIRAEQVEHVWTAFEQLDRGGSRRYGGTGLGLSLTRRIVEAQGGSVGVDSVFGRGSAFYAVLPRVSAAVLGERAPVA